MTLTDEQLATVRELRAEVRDLHLEADEQWAKYLQTGDEDCFNAALSLDGEAVMMGLIAHIPKAGERKIAKVRGKLARLRGDTVTLDSSSEARIKALDGVNEWRAQFELPPLERLPRGVPGDASECTLAKAFRMSAEEAGMEMIGVTVSNGDDIQIDARDRQGDHVNYSPDLGPAGSKVIGDFDDGDLTDLVTDDWLAMRLDDDDYDDRWKNEAQRRNLTR